MNKTNPRVIKTLHRIDEALLDNLKNHDFRKITVYTLCRSARINRDLAEQLMAGDPAGLENTQSGLLRDVYREMRTRLFPAAANLTPT